MRFEERKVGMETVNRISNKFAYLISVSFECRLLEEDWLVI